MSMVRHALLGIQPSPEVKRIEVETVNYGLENFNKFRFEWFINNLSFCRKETSEILKSSIFSAGDGDKWYLQLHPKGIDEDSKDYLSIFLRLVSCKQSDVSVKFKFSILNPKSMRAEAVELQRVHGLMPSNVYGIIKFIPRDFLLDEANGFLPADALTIHCEICYITDYSVNHSDQGNIVVPECKLSEDIGSLLDNGKFSDITLVVGEQKFQGHKNILAARSPVFAAMFEKKLNEVEIKDVDHEVLEEMLRFIYTGKSPNLADMADDLLGVADKYALEKLKAMCEKELFLKLSVETAADTLILADVHSAEQLKAQTIDFMIAHPADVINTVGWGKMIPAYPRLIADVFQALVKQKKLTYWTSK